MPHRRVPGSTRRWLRRSAFGAAQCYSWFLVMLRRGRDRASPSPNFRLGGTTGEVLILRSKPSGRLLSYIAVSSLTVGAMLLGLICFLGEEHDPFFVTFLGCCETNGWPHAVLRVKNNTSSALEFGAGYRTSCAAGDCGETAGGVQVRLRPKGSGEVFVQIPPTSFPVQIRLESNATGFHPPWLLRVCGLLDRIGVHIHHTYHSPKAPVGVLFGNRSLKSGIPFSSVLLYYDATNTLTADPFKRL